jgi:hypothetical protein
MYGSVEWFTLFQGTVQWQTVVEVVTNISADVRERNVLLG